MWLIRFPAAIPLRPVDPDIISDVRELGAAVLAGGGHAATLVGGLAFGVAPGCCMVAAVPKSGPEREPRWTINR